MKKYFVSYHRDFENAYSLFYAETAADYAALPENAKRITRKEAFRLAREESARRKYDPNFAYFATEYIYPAEYRGCDIESSPRYYLTGRIYERI